MSFFLEKEKLASSQEPRSLWEFMATNLGRNKEGGGMYSGEDRASPHLLLIARCHRVDTRKQHYIYIET